MPPRGVVREGWQVRTNTRLFPQFKTAPAHYAFLSPNPTLTSEICPHRAAC